MEKILSWRKGLFESNYQAFNNGLLKFSLNFISWKNSAIATTQCGIYLFKSEGFSKPETKLLNNQHGVLAIITYDWIRFQAKVVFASGDTFDWSFQNSWLRRWSLNNHRDKQILFNASTGSGILHTNVDDDLLILCGLFIREYYSRLLVGFSIIIFLLFCLKSVF
ncbi:hypothetical protein [Pedobacter terrae]|uniref:hypothetical protein n=1 Tax=Pedobacter terrae TaxID=405671 RepID=UPI002FFD2D30